MVAPALRRTTATTSFPHLSLGRPVTTQSYTSGCALTAASTSSAIRCHTLATSALSLNRTKWVVMGWRPKGNSRSVETSKSPKTVIATVRGIGVAVMTNKCAGVCALFLRASLCSTPNLCCSSTTITPSPRESGGLGERTGGSFDLYNGAI